MKNGGKQASSYTVNLCRKEIDLAQHAKVNHFSLKSLDSHIASHTVLLLGAIQQRIFTTTNKTKIW